MMRTMTKTPLFLALAALFLPVFVCAEGADDQFLTIPAAISEPETSSVTTSVSIAPPESLIGLPSDAALNNPPEAPKKPVDPETLISLPQEPRTVPDFPAAPSATGSEQPPIVIAAPDDSAEIVISGQAPTQAAQPDPAGKSALPVFPKDTSSAIFMVMKTWECDNYDGRTLLEHAIGVYAKESEDSFTIKGMEALPQIKVTLKESDITLDELLDVVSQKSGIDWGVDIDQKVIYLYPTHLQ